MAGKKAGEGVDHMGVFRTVFYAKDIYNLPNGPSDDQRQQVYRWASDRYGFDLDEGVRLTEEAEAKVEENKEKAVADV